MTATAETAVPGDRYRSAVAIETHLPKQKHKKKEERRERNDSVLLKTSYNREERESRLETSDKGEDEDEREMTNGSEKTKPQTTCKREKSYGVVRVKGTALGPLRWVELRLLLIAGPGGAQRGACAVPEAAAHPTKDHPISLDNWRAARGHTSQREFRGAHAASWHYSPGEVAAAPLVGARRLALR